MLQQQEISHNKDKIEEKKDSEGTEESGYP